MFVRTLFAATLVSALSVAAASAQPRSTVSTTIASPGDRVTVTVSGAPRAFFAVLGSSVGSGLSHAGVRLGVGADVVVMAQGVLDANGEASVAIEPPFTGSVLDRYYLQAVTSPAPTFVPLQAAPAHVIRNGDLTAGATSVRVRTRSALVGANLDGGVEIPCAPGERATGGGGMVSGVPGLNLTQSTPYPQLNDGETPTGWYVSYKNTRAQSFFINGYALCVAP